VRPQLIYKIANTVNDLLYVGRTDNLHKRWLKHQSDAALGSDRPLYRAIRIHGRENFFPEIIEEGLDYDTAKSRETYWIRILNTAYPCGYNALFPLLSDTEAAVIKYDAWGWSLYQYADFFGVSIATLRQLRCGMSHFNVTKDHLPQERVLPIIP
jgi:hypothetical protein